MLKRLLILCALTAAALGGAPGHAAGDGLPVPVEAGEAGIASPDGELRYQAIRADGDTVVTRVDTGSGEIAASAFLPGRFGVPLVTLSGTASGLSADGSTLVLLRPRTRFPRSRTTFAVLDTRRLRNPDVVTLDGDFSFDAVSPDGRLAYLVQYTDPRDRTSYEVRALDLRRERLLPDPIVDPDEPEEEMGGYPLARAYSPDGRWAYTLYDGKEHPFVHALDTEGRTAKCIDLQHGIGKLGRLELETSPGGERLAVVDYVGKGGGEPTPVSFIDTATFEVTEPAEPATGRGSAGGGGISPLVPIGLGIAGLAGAFLIARGTRRRAGLQT